MAYTVAWNEATPVGASTAADTIDTELQNLKKSVRERMNDILSNAWETDASDPKTIDPDAIDSMDKVILARGSNLSISDDTTTSITWDSEVSNNDSMFASGSPTIVTIQTTGFYVLHLQLGWAVDSTGARSASMDIDNTSLVPLNIRDAVATASTGTYHGCTVLLSMTAADTIRFQCYQSSGGGLNLLSNYTFAFVARIL